ncbi:MAG: hypothetical protein LKJ69_10710 [Lactobacillus sp.]|jgi:hypothetical protein|nr:hypothetical protein [Lactobacillus sp.]
MDADLLTSMVDQTIGSVVAIILLTKIDKRLEQMSTDIQALTLEIRKGGL